MKLITESLKRIVLTIIIISILITFFATPAAYAKLDLQDGDYYYSGTTEGTYVPSGSIFGWLINNIGNIADYLLGILTLIIRMPFIGWTALLEKMLTWAIESTTGLSTEGDIVVSSTDYTGLTDSSRNITVESIVYNRVPALSIDLFELELDKTMSATGQKLVCKYCEMEIGVDPISGTTYPIYHEKPVTECIKETDPAKINLKDKTEDYCSDDCACFGCDACEQYLIALKKTEDPLIIRLRQFVATWYSIIRLLAMAAMLVVLIGIGIKMALSTIASDKAVFKRMLVDWVVGVIIIFVLHYFMYMVIYINNVMVDVIADSAQSINEVQLSRLPEGAVSLTDSELELKIYEEVRTRAYDAKLSNGLIGTIMYMTLVYFAFKYTIIYVKRLLTIIVLTLMAPGVGVAYALQKALTGKSQALKTWMTEYIMNVIIQIVHALIYAIFISQALIMSLQNVSGMILALILMNYTSKAGTLFKKVFNFGGGDSLLGHTENANQSLKEGINAATGIAMGAAPVAKMMAKSPVGQLGKLAGAAVMVGLNNFAYKGYTGGDEDEAEEQGQDAPPPENGNDNPAPEDGGNPGGNGGGDASPDTPPADGAIEPLNDAEIMATGGEKLRDELEACQTMFDSEGPNPSQATRNKLLNAKRKYNRFQQLKVPTSKEVAKAHVQRLVSMENVFVTKKPESTWGQIRTAAFGSYYRDPRTGKKVYENNSWFSQFNSSELLGLTDKDKKLHKEFGGDLLKGVTGMASIFFGMGVIVDNPGIGFGLLATGVKNYNTAFGRDPSLSRQSGRYTFSRFGVGSIDTIKNSALAQAQREHNAILAKELELTHPDLLSQLRKGKVMATTMGYATGVAGIAGGAGLAAIPAAALTGALAGTTMFMATRFTRNTKIAGKLAEIDKHSREQTIKQMKEFEDDAITLKSRTLQADASERHQKEDRQALDRLLNADIVAEGVIRMGTLKSDGTMGVAVEQSETKVKRDDVLKTVTAEDGTEKTITAADVKAVDKELDRLILELTSGSSTLDISSKKVQAEILNRLSLHFEGTGLLAQGQNISSIFKEGEAGLIKTMRSKAAVRNQAIQEAAQALEEKLRPEDVPEIQNAISQMLQTPDETTGKVKDISEIKAEDVMALMKKPNTDGSQQADSGRDGSRSVTGDGTQKRIPNDAEYALAINEYLKAMQDNRPQGPAIRDLTDAEKRKVEERKSQFSKAEIAKKKGIVKKQREDYEAKSKQVLAAIWSTTDPEQGDELLRQLLENKNGDAVLEFVERGKPGEEDKKHKVVMTESQVDALLADNRTIQSQVRLNEEKRRSSYDIPSGSTKAYTKTTLKRVDLATTIHKLDKERIVLEGMQDGSQPVSTPDAPARTIETVQAELAAAKQAYAEYDRVVARTGPEVNVSSYISSTLYKNVKKDSRKNIKTDEQLRRERRKSGSAE